MATRSLVAKVVDTLAIAMCLKRVLLSAISLFHYFILFKRRNPPTPESMLFEVKERLEGIKCNIYFGVGVHRGESIGMSTMQRGAIL